MADPLRGEGETLAVAPYFDVLLQRIRSGDERARVAFGRHVHWGCWPEPERADGSPQDYADAAERLCRKVCDAAGVRDGMRVLDVGCGLGGTVASLNERFSGLDLVGVNIDPRQLASRRETVRPMNGNRLSLRRGGCLRSALRAGIVRRCPRGRVHLPLPEPGGLPARGVVGAGTGRSAGAVRLYPAPPVAADAEDPRGRARRGHAPELRQVDLLCPLEQYRALAEEAGLVPITARTSTSRPCRPMRSCADQRAWSDRPTARCHERATVRLENVCRLGLLSYTILSLSRPNVA